MTTRDIGDFFETETSSGTTGKSYLLAIGIDAYQHPKVPRLYNAVRDAEKLVTVLTAKYQFEKAHVTELTNEEATEENILEAIDSLIGKVTETDNVIIYFSGHGAFRENLEQGYWVPVEGRFNNAASTISNSTLTDHLRAIKARHLILIVDACFGGTLIQQNRGSSLAIEEADDHYYQEIYQIPSRWLLTSGRKEPVLDGTPGKHSPFASHLLNTLKENQNKRLSIQELGRKVAIAVNQEGYDQLPFSGAWNISDQHQGGEFIFEIVRDPGTALAGKEWDMVIRQLSFWERIPKKTIKQVGMILVAWVVFFGFLVGFWPHFEQFFFKKQSTVNVEPNKNAVPATDTTIAVTPPRTLGPAPRIVPINSNKAKRDNRQRKNPDSPLIIPETTPPKGLKEELHVEPVSAPTKPLSAPPPPNILVNKHTIPLGPLEKGTSKSFDFEISNENAGSKERISLSFDEQFIEIEAAQQFSLEFGRPIKIKATLNTDNLPLGAYQSEITIIGSNGQKIKVTANIIETMCPVYFIGASKGSTISVPYGGRTFEGKDSGNIGKITVQLPKKLIENRPMIKVTTSAGQSARWLLECDKIFEF